MKQTIQLGVLSALNIGIGFLFQWYVLTQLGPGVETDALFAGMTLPQLVLAVISGSLMHVLVPLLSGENKDNLHADAWGVFILVGSLFGLIAVALYFTAFLWVPLTVPGFDNAGKVLTISLTRIQLIGMVFAAINGVQWATYHAKQNFVWAEFTPIIASTFSLMLLVWALPRFGVIAAAWISVVRMAVQSLLLAPGMGKPVWPDFKSRSIILAWQRIKPLVMGTVYYKTDPLVDRFLLSSAGSGSLSLYYLAQQIYGAASQVLNRAVAAPLVPLLSKLNKTGNDSQYRQVYHQKLLQVGFVGVVSLLILGLFGKGVLGLLVSHGNVSAENVKELWWIMILLGGMFFGGTLASITSSSFYALGDTTTLVKVSMISYTGFIICKVIAFFYWGLAGLAIATSIYYMTNLLIQMFYLRKR